MKKTIIYIIHGIVYLYSLILLNGCMFIDNEYGKKPLVLVKKIDIPKRILNVNDFYMQLNKIKKYAPVLYEQNFVIYNKVKRWLKDIKNTNKLNELHLDTYRMPGIDRYYNVHLTAYHTPIIYVSHIKTDEFQYPIYSYPIGLYFPFELPSRRDIYNGHINQKYVIAYSNSLIDNYLMQLQGNGYIYFVKEQKTYFLRYNGTNGYIANDVREKLIDRGEMSFTDFSMNTVINWAKNHTDSQIEDLLSYDPSYVFFTKERYRPIVGESNVPLISNASVAVDTNVIPLGTVLLVKMPIFNEYDTFNETYEFKLMIALDTNDTVKGQQLDLYEGYGDNAKHISKLYNRYGRVWVLK